MDYAAKNENKAHDTNEMWCRYCYTYACENSANNLGYLHAKQSACKNLREKFYTQLQFVSSIATAYE